MGGLFLEIYFVYIVRMFWRLVSLLRSRRWNTANATILGVHLNTKGHVSNSVSIDYEYAVDGQKRADTFLKPFIWDSSAELYASEFTPGMTFKIRVNPGDPEVSIADSSVEYWWNHLAAKH